MVIIESQETFVNPNIVNFWVRHLFWIEYAGKAGKYSVQSREFFQVTVWERSDKQRQILRTVRWSVGTTRQIWSLSCHNRSRCEIKSHYELLLKKSLIYSDKGSVGLATHMLREREGDISANSIEIWTVEMKSNDLHPRLRHPTLTAVNHDTWGQALLSISSFLFRPWIQIVNFNPPIRLHRECATTRNRPHNLHIKHSSGWLHDFPVPSSVRRNERGMFSIW